MAKTKQIYFSWHSYNGGFIVAANALKLLKEKYDISIDEIWYLHNDFLSEQAIREKKAFFSNDDKVKKTNDEELRKKVRECEDIAHFLGAVPEFKNRLLKVTVTNYQEIYDEVLAYLKSKLEENKELQIHINVSPGTPQMHVVWLMLNSAGFLPQNTKLWSTQFIKKQGKTVLKEITFKPKTYLSQVFESRYNRKYKVKVNPNETQSGKRKEAEYKILLFSKIPNAPILLMGERGIGKSTYVRELIFSQTDKSCIELACGTFSQELLRSELFGHKKGSFSGATENKDGLLTKLDDGGYLFLDEIHDLQKPLQRQLMQVLQTGEYYPVGSTKPEKANFNLITASNKSIKALNGELLDKDFFDRIARFVVEIPPLRESKADIKQYWEKAWQELSNFDKAPDLIWNEQIENYLLKQPLYGNFRDLQKIISYLMAYKIAGFYNVESFEKAKAEFEKWKDKSLTIVNEEMYFKRGKTYKEIESKFNRDLAEWAINEYGGIKQAAKALKRGESTLYDYNKKNTESNTIPKKN